MNSKQKIREKFRSEVYKRDKFTCRKCGQKKAEHELNAHHITDRNEMPNGGYVKENGITLCEGDCHMAAEKFHITDGKEWNLGLHPDDLYKMIGSSYQMAVEASKRLK